MRYWTVPEQWVASEAIEPDAPESPVNHSVPMRPMRRQPLRKSGGFLQIDNIFAELDDEVASK